MEVKTLNPSQVMLVQSFSTFDTKEDTAELMEVLKAFYARKLDEEMLRLWDDGTLNQNVLDDLKSQHLRVHSNG